MSTRRKTRVRDVHGWYVADGVHTESEGTGYAPYIVTMTPFVSDPDAHPTESRIIWNDGSEPTVAPYGQPMTHTFTCPGDFPTLAQVR